MEGLEKERDFYFGKLKDVKVMCQENESTGRLGQEGVGYIFVPNRGWLLLVPDEEEGVPPPPEEGDENINLDLF